MRVAEFAELLGVQEPAVRTMCQDGRLPTARREIDGWEIPDADARSFAASYVRPKNTPPGRATSRNNRVICWLSDAEMAGLRDAHERSGSRLILAQWAAERLAEVSP